MDGEIMMIGELIVILTLETMFRFNNPTHYL